VTVEELAPGLWRWSSRHPEWTAEEDWEPDVSSYYVAGGGALVLIDPLVPADEEERFWQALDRDVAEHGPPQVLLTVFWHARSTQAVLDRYEGAMAFAPAAWPDEARERVPGAELYELGDTLAAGIEAKGTEHRGEALLWIPSHNALAAGDILLGTSDGGVRTCPDSWLRPGVTGEQIREGLRPLLELPVERLLLTHGEAIVDGAHAKLEAALVHESL
jgi:glyoxylase-like metal-dependent hydrolase (beta-lactamase superfamily II)